MQSGFTALNYATHTLEVPLVWDDPDARRLEIFARVVWRKGGEDLPYLLFLQGGPGGEGPRPSLNPANPSWLDVALERYRVVMLDQRGTGNSTPLGDDFLVSRPAADVAEYCTHLRMEAIVADAEALREHLGAPTWSVLGQSYGGFCLTHYLSVHPESIRHAYFTGGLPAVGRHPDEVYALTFDKMIERSLRYYEWFPGDRDKVARLVDLASAGRITLPGGERLSATKLRSLGHLLGGDDGALRLHWILERDPFSNAFRHDVAAALPFGGRSPLYAVIHEASWADGAVTSWSCERVRPSALDDDPTLLTGEHLFPEWFEEGELAPWKDVANLLAEHAWPQVYDPAVLAGSRTVGAAAIYFGDVYVPQEFSLETAKLVPDVIPFVTSEYEHSGLRTSGGKVLRHLFELAAGERIR